MILGIRTVIYHVKDLAKAKDWYAKAFGVKPYFDEPFYVGFNIGGFETGLHPKWERARPRPGGSAAPWGVRRGQPPFWAFLGCRGAGSAGRQECADGI